MIPTHELVANMVKSALVWTTLEASIPLSAKDTPSVPLNFGTSFAVELPGPTAHVEQLMPPVELTEIGELSAAAATS